MRYILLLTTALALLATCTFQIDPDESTFTCEQVSDCGAGYVCIQQKAQSYGVCHPEGSCQPADTCDGQDEDCDGVVDDDVPESLGPCTADGETGRCAQGNLACVEGAPRCLPGLPSQEQCNQLDDDCDALVDEDFDFARDSAHCGGCGNVCPPGTGCVDAACRELWCDDGLDNDTSDGGADCQDAFCIGQRCSPDGGFNCGRTFPANVDGGVPGCVPLEHLCANAQDDDGDGHSDCKDLDCEGAGCDGGTCSGGECR